MYKTKDIYLIAKIPHFFTILNLLGKTNCPAKLNKIQVLLVMERAAFHKLPKPLTNTLTTHLQNNKTLPHFLKALKF